MTAIISITKQGNVLAQKLTSSLKPCTCYTLDKWNDGSSISIEGGLKEYCKTLFEMHEKLLFIMATGIVVRCIAPYIRDKTIDPAIVVVDDKGTYAISLLSGHIGGANAFTQKIAEAIGAKPVITTASDIHNLPSVDMLALEYNLTIDSMNDAKIITAMLVNNLKVLLEDECKILPMNNFETIDNDCDGAIIITNKLKVKNSKPFVKMIPKNIVIGVGCKKDTDPTQMIHFISDICNKVNIDTRSIKKIASVSIKSEEDAIWKSSEYFNAALTFYDTATLKTVDHLFQGSSFVLGKIGVGSVSSTAAYLAGNKSGKFLVTKEISNGLTVSVFQSDEDNICL